MHLIEALRLQVEGRAGWRTGTYQSVTRQRDGTAPPGTKPLRTMDLDAGWLRIEPGETKNREGRMFPLTAALRECLVTQLGRTRDVERRTGKVIPWIFHRNGSSIGSFRDAWRQACIAAAMPGQLFHDFRRTAVRNLERAGVPTSAVMAMVGHETEAIYRR
jgi:integrase